MSEHLSAPLNQNDAVIDNAVPEDFPIPVAVLDMLDEGPASSGEEIDVRRNAIENVQKAYAGRFEACQDLVLRLCTLIVERGEASALPAARHRLLERYRSALAAAKWTSEEEATWIAQRIAFLLKWDKVPLFRHPWRRYS